MPPQEKYEARFYFISELTLRKNLADALQYITQLAGLYVIHENENELRISFCKTIIIYTASIIEACLHFCLKHKITEDIFEKPEWKYVDTKLIYKIPQTGEEIVSARRIRVRNKINFRHIKFQQLNKICLDRGILNKNLFDMCEKIKDLRNKIHLANLSTPDRKYSKKHIDEVFEIASNVLSTIERELTS